VGRQYFKLFFERCSELLHPEGLMLLQAILIEDSAYEAEKASRSFINKLIFPGGCLPSMQVIERCLDRLERERYIAKRTAEFVGDAGTVTYAYPDLLDQGREQLLNGELLQWALD